MKRFFDGDVWWSFKRNPLVIIAAITALLWLFGSAFAPWLSPHNPFDLKTINLLDAFTPPSWIANGKPQFLFGTDDQGRDVLSTIMHGSRITLLVSICAVMLSMIVGISLGLVSGYVGGKLDAFIMRVADIQLSFPAILIALLIDGVARVVVGKEYHDQIAVYVLIFAIAAFGAGLSDPDEPDVWLRDFTGQTRLWIEVGQPDDKPLIKACAKADAVVLYCFSHAAEVWWRSMEAKLARPKNLTVFRVPTAAAQALIPLAQRNMQLQATIQEGVLMLGDGAHHVDIEPLRWLPVL